MLVMLRNLFAMALTSPCPDPSFPETTKEKWAAGLLGLAVAAWIFSYKLMSFFGLTTTSDLYVSTQLATTWLDGRFLHDNCFGNVLATHTYLFCPVLAIFCVPLGAIGLLLALSLAAGAQILAIIRILRLLGVSGGVACLVAAAMVMMPLSLHAYRDAFYGFHVELLIPAMALWLAYYLLKRRWAPAMTIALLLLSVKEDSPLIVAVIATTVLGEDIIRRFLGRPSATSSLQQGWNPVAATTLLLAVIALPALLYLLQTQTPTGYSPGSFARLKVVGDGAVSNGGSLLAYVLNHLSRWLTSPVIMQWLWLAVVTPLGFAFFRPHLLLIGIGTTLISWLMQDDLFWPPRFAQTLAFFQIIGCLGFASIYSLVCQTGEQGWHRMLRIILGVTVTVGALLSVRAQFSQVSATVDVYLMQPALGMDASELEQADQLFSIYRREGRKNEPVIASPFLFRYAHDRDLYWYDRLVGRPAPVWILWDSEELPLSTLWAAVNSAKDGIDKQYRLVGQSGRFLLFKLKDQETPTTPDLPAHTGGKEDG